MSTIAVNQITDASGGSTAQINGATPTVYNTMGRNRIINGDMRIDQRNAGASVTAVNNVYLVDRWYYAATQASNFTAQQNAGSVTPPDGFKNYLGFTTSSAYSVGSGDLFVAVQRIEGYNMADFGWGTANAKTVTLSFWVRSSLTGTFGGSFANDGGGTSYPYSYTINSANTWEYKTITIAGPSIGSWNSTNGMGIQIVWSLGVGSNYSGTAGSWSANTYLAPTGNTSVVGTNGATFYLTGVQLEVGSVATEFERRPYGTELALCQRYYQLVEGGPFGSVTSTVYYGSTVGFSQMRVAPTPTWVQTISAYGFPTTASTAISATVRSFVIYKAANASLGGCYFQDQFSLSAEL